MDINTANSIIVGAVAIVSSLLTAALAYFFQARELDKKHKWEIEYQKKEIKQSIKLNRIKQTEELVTRIYERSYGLFNNIDVVMKDTAIVEPEMLKFFSMLATERQNLRALNLILDDADLSIHLTSFVEATSNLFELFVSNSEEYEEKFQKKPFSEAFGSCLNDLTTPFCDIIKCLDKLRYKIIDLEYE